MDKAENLDLTPAEARRLETFKQRYREEARALIGQRLNHFQPLTGGTYTSVTIRDQKTRWGSCSSRGTLSFNYRLIFAPPAILDYVVVHELCHLTHMNHSAAFWAHVSSVLPDYRVRRQWLKDHGQELSVERHMEKRGIPLKLEETPSHKET